MAQHRDNDRTVLESADEIIKALAARKERRQAETLGLPPALPASVVQEAQRDRPVQRPPMAQLCIFDDGATDGEWIRLRADRTVIGRTEGDVLIPHDGQIANPHTEILRER